VSTVFDKLDPRRRQLLDELRSRIMELDGEVIEQVRPHRIVYSKNFMLMDFAEITFEGRTIHVRPIGRSPSRLEPIIVDNAESMRRALDAVSQALKRLGG
jgi:hypothetical protein